MDGKGLALASRTHGALKALRWNEVSLQVECGLVISAFEAEMV